MKEISIFMMFLKTSVDFKETNRVELEEKRS